MILVFVRHRRDDLCKYDLLRWHHVSMHDVLSAAAVVILHAHIHI